MEHRSSTIIILYFYLINLKIQLTGINNFFVSIIILFCYNVTQLHCSPILKILYNVGSILHSL